MALRIESEAAGLASGRTARNAIAGRIVSLLGGAKAIDHRFRK